MKRLLNVISDEKIKYYNNFYDRMNEVKNIR